MISVEICNYGIIKSYDVSKIANIELYINQKMEPLLNGPIRYYPNLYNQGSI